MAAGELWHKLKGVIGTTLNFGLTKATARFTLSWAGLTAARTITVPDATGTLVLSPVGVTDGGTGLASLPDNQCGRLTTESGVAVSTSDRTAQGTLYFTPHRGSVVYLYNGSAWAPYQFAEVLWQLSTIGAVLGVAYDLFLYPQSLVPSSTNTGTDVVTFGANHNAHTGSMATVSATGGGLTVGTKYFFRRASATTGTFHTTAAGAAANTGLVDLTASVTATVTFLVLAAAWSWDAFIPSSTNTTTDVLTFSATLAWATGDQITADTTAGGLTAGVVYYWRVLTGTTGQLHTTAEGAAANTGRVDLTASITNGLYNGSYRGAGASTTELELFQGHYVNKNSLASFTTGGPAARVGLYVGSFRATATSQTEDSATKRFLFSWLNPVPKSLQRLEATSSWAYSTAAYRQGNGSTANQVAVLVGIAGQSVNLILVAGMSHSVANNYGYVAIGEDSALTPATGCTPFTIICTIATFAFSAFSTLTKVPAIGHHAYVWLERGNGAATGTWYGNAGAADVVQCGLTMNNWMC